MPMKIMKKEIETEREIGYRYLQVLSRAEALTPGAGREAIDVLLWDANAVVARTDVQSDRVVLDGTLSCQAVYRQGDESTLRAVNAKAGISQAAEIPGAQGGMMCRVQSVVENVEAKYENGHMVFLVSLGFHVWVMKLENLEVIDGIEETAALETRYAELCLVKLAAEANETAVLTARVEVPQAIDARATLMDWGTVALDSSEPDLGGVRVKGRATVETLIASGVAGKPAVAVKYPIEFDKLIELPEWLSRDAHVTPTLRAVRTQLERSDENSEGELMIQADVHFDIAANLRECVRALEDAYATDGTGLTLQMQTLEACTGVERAAAVETVRGAALIPEGAPAASGVVAVRAIPNIAEINAEAGGSRISGIIETTVLYLSGENGVPASVGAGLPFEARVPQQLGERSEVRMSIISAEANALMGDRFEIKIMLSLDCETRVQQRFELVSDIEAGACEPKRPGYVIAWPEPDDDAWSIGKRYGIAAERVESGASDGAITAGSPVILRI